MKHSNMSHGDNGTITLSYKEEKGPCRRKQYEQPSKEMKAKERQRGNKNIMTSMDEGNRNVSMSVRRSKHGNVHFS